MTRLDPPKSPWGLSTRGLKLFSQPHVLKHQLGTHGSPRIKTPRSKPPKSKLQDPNPQNQNSKIQTTKIKTPRSNPPKSKLQNPNPQNSKIKTYIIFLVHDRSPPKKLTNIFLANHQHNEQNIKMEVTNKNQAIYFSP